MKKLGILSDNFQLLLAMIFIIFCFLAVAAWLSGGTKYMKQSVMDNVAELSN